MDALIRFLFLAVMVNFGTGDILSLTCIDAARKFTVFHTNGVLQGFCPNGCKDVNAVLKGSHVYTDDSSICRAALHDGVINNNGGLVNITRLRGKNTYDATEHNGIKSSKSGHWEHSFSYKFASQSCVHPLGMSSGRIADDSFASSSVFRTWSGAQWLPSLGRLKNTGMVNAWRPNVDNLHQWWQVDLGKIYDVRGIITQGSKRYGLPQFITSFKVHYKLLEETPWLSMLNETGLPKIFSGNSNNNGFVTNHFVPSVAANFIRVVPVTWENHISLRAEILGC